MKRCPACNKTYGEEQNFCLEDGSPLVGAASVPEARTENLPYSQGEAPTEVMYAAQTAPPPSPYTQPVGRVGRRSPLPWILGGVVLIAGIVAVVIFATRGQNGAGGPSGGSPAASGFRQENSADNLKSLFEEIGKAKSGNDTKRAAALTRGLLPDESRIRKALRDDVPEETVKRIVAWHQKLLPSSDDNSVAGLFSASADTKVQVSGETTEEIKAAHTEFPGGARDLADQALRPNMTFYEVGLGGMKYHLFFWDGTQWTMLGPIWRAFR